MNKFEATSLQQARSKYASENICPICNSTDVTLFFEVDQIPVNSNLLVSSRQQALNVTKGDIHLGFCEKCGHIYNAVFQPEIVEYSEEYENSLHFSPRFQTYAISLANRLIQQYNLSGKNIIEIGCGQGDFLKLLCRLGGNRGIGFDPSYVEPAVTEDEQVTFIQDFYSERYVDYKADLICCRHVLEHIPNPLEFLTTLRRAIGNNKNTVVFFEVPNALNTLQNLVIWDIIYSHYSYFTPSSLAKLFTLCGFKVCHLKETFEGQYIYIEALPVENSENSVDYQEHWHSGLSSLSIEVAAFADNYRRKVGNWGEQIEQHKDANQRVVLWGAGAKGVSFLNTLKIEEEVNYVVDINPRKQGKYIPGTGQPIVLPAFLRNYDLDTIILTNPVYRTEIQKLTANFGLKTNILCA